LFSVCSVLAGKVQKPTVKPFADAFEYLHGSINERRPDKHTVTDQGFFDAGTLKERAGFVGTSVPDTAGDSLTEGKTARSRGPLR
jgi:hypothetical protein